MVDRAASVLEFLKEKPSIDAFLGLKFSYIYLYIKKYVYSKH